MAKLMLVEDDNNLREIYEARLQAEGYTIVSARDGEEALVVAKAEKPDLIISDVMMPKISGFEMLDILRNTEGLKEVKVIMLTALGQTDDQQRADRLGADRYLVKSQVTLEDIVKVAHELLDGGGDEAGPTATPEPPATPPAAPEPPSTPPASPTTPEPPATTPPATTTSASASEPSATAAAATPAAAPVAEPASQSASDDSGSAAQSTADEEAAVEAKIEDFVAGATDQPVAPETAAADDKLMADAVESLVSSASAGSDDKPAADTEAETETIKPEAAAEPVATDQPAEAKTELATNQIAGKKVIEPIADDSKKNIEDLVALEAAKEDTAKGPVIPKPVIVTNDSGVLPEPTEPEAPITPPSGTVAPTEEPAAKEPTVTDPKKVDPSSIAL